MPDLQEKTISTTKHSPAPDPRLAQALLNWYAQHRRDLPWRQSGDPYRVWISEIMLQQTRVATVIPYYERWLDRFPSVQALAAADEQEVLSLWQGLGYYSRARSLHRAAQVVVQQHAGQLPGSVEALCRLPGIGPYTAGAVASIAFGLDEPAVDGNVIRVLARLEAIEGDPQRVGVRRAIEELARHLIPPGHAADFNQALMELGATCCVPRNPHCDECPLRGHCAARRRGHPEDFPQVRKRPAPTLRRHVALLVRHDDRILMEQIAADAAWWAGMWRLPTVEVNGIESNPAAAARACGEFLGGPSRPVEFRTRLVHHVTRYRVELQLWHAQVNGRRVAAGLHWISRTELEELALPAPYRKLVRRRELDSG